MWVKACGGLRSGDLRTTTPCWPPLISHAYTHWPHVLWCSSKSVNDCHYLSQTPPRLQQSLWATLLSTPQPLTGHGPARGIRDWAEREQSVGQPLPSGWELECRSALQGSCSWVITDRSAPLHPAVTCMYACMIYTQASLKVQYIAISKHDKCKSC